VIISLSVKITLDVGLKNFENPIPVASATNKIPDKASKTTTIFANIVLGKKGRNLMLYLFEN
jgi:hypothetical protein